MEYTVLVRVVKELTQHLAGARVERVYQGSEGILIVLSHAAARSVLLISPDRAMPRLHLVSEKPPAIETAHPFVLYLRSHVSGARIVSIEVLDQDRIVALRLRQMKEEYRLLFELFGGSANLFLLNASNTILSTYHPIHLIDHAERSFCIGMTYHPPVTRPLQQPETPCASEPAAQAVSVNREVELHYAALSEKRSNNALRLEIASCLKKAIAKTEKLVAALTADLAHARRLSEYKQAGDLILANLKELRTGMARAELAGYDGMRVAVDLDPKRSPSRNAEMYFKKYKKAKTGLDVIARRLHRTEEETVLLRSLHTQLETAQSLDDLNDLRRELAVRGYMRARRGETPDALTKAKPQPYRTVLFQGWEILIGRNAAGNDHLSTKVARSDDLWLHAEGMPGSHVLVRNPGKGEVPHDVLLKAASLAAYHSKGRTAAKVSVTYTRAGLVKKPKGAKSGLVTLSERKSVMVRPAE